MPRRATDRTTKHLIDQVQQDLYDGVWANARTTHEQNALNVLFHPAAGWTRSWAVQLSNDPDASTPIITAAGKATHIDWAQAKQVVGTDRSHNRQHNAFLRAAIQLAAGQPVDYNTCQLDRHARQSIREIVAFWFETYDTIIETPTSADAAEIADDMMFHLDQQLVHWQFWNRQATHILIPYFLAASIGNRTVADVHCWITQRDSTPKALTSEAASLLRTTNTRDAHKTLQNFQSDIANQDIIGPSYAIAETALVASVRTHRQEKSPR
jgi:hypothetical protein